MEMQILADAGGDKRLVDSEMQKGRHSVFNFVVSNFTARVIEEKLDQVLDILKCAVKLNLALGFILKSFEDGRFRYFYAHENNTLLEQYKLVSNKDDKAKLKEILKETDVIESCTKGRSNTKWRFFKITDLTIFAALLREARMQLYLNLFQEIIQSIALLTNRTSKKPYKDNLCLFRALALQLHGNESLKEQTSNIFNLLLFNSTNPDSLLFQEDCKDDIHLCKI